MTELAYLHPQENFPREDLTEENAALLELLFQNEHAFNTSHAAAERYSILYRVGHGVLVAASRPHVIQHESDAISHGIGTYESISKIVSPRERFYQNTMFAGPHIEMAYLAVNNNFYDETVNLATLFRNHLPNTSRVVEATAGRFHGGAIDYAVVGAALAYELDMGTSVEECRAQEERDE